MRSPLSRRALLLLGASGAGAALLSGCGLRLDTPPDVPTLDATEQLRNRIAAILEATTAADDDPETAGEDLQKFTAAIGPIWSPPSEMATEPPPSEGPRTYVEAAEEISSAVFEATAALDPSLAPVLVDVATGLTLTAGTVKAQIVSTADELIRDSRDSGSRDSGSADTSDEGEGEDISKSWKAVLDQARAASYGYERLAVNFDSKSPERKSAVARLESLGSLTGEMLEKLGESKTGQGAPAWRLDPSPTSADTARELALNLEDALASAILPWLQADSLATLRLWESARARTAFAAAQALRFTSPGDGGDAEAEQ